ncbi:hypothetical protein [Sphingobacterium psychroaquaticum]|uniref:Uncharacterized protein n=1 Tax=Sphingobacterium psychroaquaticum TaxID=561061 RepID=A0A1X7LF03_9SPHI|nr:hypothetical protein [Sphingobacterium psychroaquaticum]QBQ40689.1 hypothetical protein E2P86_05805 [Sphingobacterium psychroaquaticum]SMG51832.1 hypothetical protein SAMN05660862_0028 [Sphingobacterium psychroaquaticum]
MLNYLKESTFRANEVFLRAMSILRKHYISIAGLCFLLFVTNNLSSFLAMYLKESAASGVKVLLLFVFLTLFFSLQLMLIKRALNLVSYKKKLGFMGYIPTTKQFVSFIVGLLTAILISVIVACLVYVLCFPLLYMGISMDRVMFEIHPVITGIISVYIILRTMFFPFFILDKNFSVFKSYRFSLAVTRGNVFRLVLVLLLVSSTFLLQLGSEYLEYNLLARAFSIINSFIVIPSVSLVLSIVYSDMMSEYKGEGDPEFLKNII